MLRILLAYLMLASLQERALDAARIKKAKRMRSILLKGFGFTEIAEAVDSECNELAKIIGFG